MKLLRIREDGQIAGWPRPLPHVARDVCASTAALYGKRGFLPPWIGYVAEHDGELVGTCAFTSPPREGRVEIAYFTFPGFEGRGIATTMARRLIEITRGAAPDGSGGVPRDAAGEAAPGPRITAHTLPQENASTAILRKLGFVLGGTVMDPEDGAVWEWLLPPEHPRRSRENP